MNDAATGAGRVVAVCTSRRKGVQKRPQESVLLEVGLGIEGDAHRGFKHRQVSLLAQADIDFMRAKGADVHQGDFGENIICEGLDLTGLGMGSELRVGQVRLRLSQIGKACHDHCAIYYAVGECIMPRLGCFFTVEEGGEVRPGDEIKVLKRVDPALMQCAVLTVSDRCSKGEATDSSGPALVALLEKNSGFVLETACVPDEPDQIEAVLREWADRQRKIDLVLTTGGTGLSPRDSTPEATKRVIERETPGLSEYMRAAGLAKTPRAMLSRGVSGISGRTLILNLPGSRKGAVESLEAVLAVLPHAVHMLRGEVRDCGR
jgi:molybdenum cofactor synthesis domain-containing protein